MNAARRLARGAGAGLAAGLLWWAVEWSANWALGGTLSAGASLTILGLDLVCRAVRGGLVGLPLAAVVADRLVALVVRRDAFRFGLEVGCAVLALFIWGQPLATAALDTTPAAVPSPRGAPDVILVSLDTTRADHM